MNHAEVDPELLPTLRELSQATVVAAVIAALLVVMVVLPAEAGIDPTGIGRWMGLTAMGELKLEGASSAPPAPPPAVAEVYAFRTDELTLPLQPNEGAEIKAVMRSGDQMVYTWTADRGPIDFDFHGEPKGAAANVFTTFEKGSDSAAQGDFEAPFEGVHGWYWKNTTAEVVTVKLNTSGVYAKIARKM
jgi:hypothetical protein